MKVQPRGLARPLPGTLTYRVHGPGDYFHMARLHPDGRFRVEQGSFRSAPPRIGRIGAEDRLRLDLLLARIAPLASWSYGPRLEAFESELRVDAVQVPRTFRWSANSIGVPRAIVALAELLRAL